LPKIKPLVDALFASQRRPGTNPKPIPGPHLVYGFLTPTPNAVVEPTQKAMPVT
jgi:hypothetical protein